MIAVRAAMPSDSSLDKLAAPKMLGMNEFFGGWHVIHHVHTAFASPKAGRPGQKLGAPAWPAQRAWCDVSSHESSFLPPLPSFKSLANRCDREAFSQDSPLRAQEVGSGVQQRCIWLCSGC